MKPTAIEIRIRITGVAGVAGLMGLMGLVGITGLAAITAHNTNLCCRVALTALNGR